ncbi:MAG: cation diffusion facilitator family transporter [Thermoflavifilum sp.]|nr:cation diffusion facilitator family transporter [Thermoflavifilum sp.]
MLLSLGISICLTMLKTWAYLQTHSVAILSDALESIINIVTAALAMYSVHLSALPRDINHPYGHGKVEFFSVGVEGAMIFIAGILIAVKAIHYFFQPYALQKLSQGLLLVGITAVVNLFLGWFLIHQGKKLPSLTIQGNGQHILTDAYSTGGLLIALFAIQWSGWTWIDPIASLGIGAWVVRKGYKLVRRSISGLMDEANPELIDRVVEILATHRHTDWIDIHNFRIQQYGNNFHIDCHLTLPYYYSLEQVHRENEALTQILKTHIRTGEIECFIHVDPCQSYCCVYCQIFTCPVRKHPFQQKLPWTKSYLLLPHHPLAKDLFAEQPSTKGIS